MAQHAIAVCAIVIVTLALVGLATAEGGRHTLGWWPSETIANLEGGAMARQTAPVSETSGASTTSFALSVGFTVLPTPPRSGDNVVYLPLVFH